LLIGFDALAGNGREDSVDSAKNGPLSEALETAWEGPTIDLFTADLLRVRVGIDGVIDRVSAAGQHLSLVYNVTEFLHEAKAAMMSQCDDILLEALQDELALLRQDRYLLTIPPTLPPSCGNGKVASKCFFPYSLRALHVCCLRVQDEFLTAPRRAQKVHCWKGGR
jgi:hypothetical protein